MDTQNSNEEQQQTETRGEQLMQVFGRFMEFMVTECFPETGLEELLEKLIDGVTLELLVDWIVTFLVPGLPAKGLSDAMFRVLMDQVQGNLLNSPDASEDIKDVVRKLDLDKLTEKQVNRIYRYLLYFTAMVQ